MPSNGWSYLIEILMKRSLHKPFFSRGTDIENSVFKVLYHEKLFKIFTQDWKSRAKWQLFTFTFPIFVKQEHIIYDLEFTYLKGNRKLLAYFSRYSCSLSPFLLLSKTAIEMQLLKDFISTCQQLNFRVQNDILFKEKENEVPCTLSSTIVRLKMFDISYTH